MKKLIALTMVVIIGLLCLPGCGGSPLADAGFTENADGSYTILDTAGSPLPQGGVKIDLVTGPQGYANFTVTDTEGTETADYYTFTPADSNMLRHRYVAAMGMTYNYYYDYAAMKLVKVTDADDADVTEGLKMGGRWESAASETMVHAKDLLAYFEAGYGMTIDEAVGK